jgi:hypothetical protein
MCEVPLEKGDTYLVYASEWENSKETLITGTFCSRTDSLETAQDDIYFLRGLLKNQSEPRIYGSVHRYDKDLAKDSSQYAFLEAIKIVAQSAKRRFITFTDRNGLYSFNKLPNGKYKVYPELPKKYTLSWWYNLDEINLKSIDNPYLNNDFKIVTGRNAYSEFQVVWNNQISGKVLDAEGKPLERATVKLIPLNQVNDTPLLERNNAEELRQENRESNIKKYNISNLTPGKYVLAVEVFAPFPSGSQRLRMYYPQTTNLEKAEIINLEEFDKRNIDIKLPTGFVVREIEGSLLWSSGLPIEEGYVSLEKLENSEDKDNVVYDSIRVENGKFKFQAFENVEYWIHPKYYKEEAKPIKIKVEKTNEPVKIVIRLLK